MVQNTDMASDALDITEKALIQAQGDSYVERKTRSDFFGRVAGYLSWVATSTMMATAVSAYNFFSSAGPGIFNIALNGGSTALTGTIIPAAGGVVAAGLPLLAIGMAAVSIIALTASILFSRKSREISSEGDIVMSQLDSKNQSRGVVHAFAKVQYSAKQKNAAIETASGASAMPWTERVSNGAAKSAPEQKTWVDFVAQKAQEEDLQKLSDLQNGRG
jgi:hypothetical protein